MSHDAIYNAMEVHKKDLFSCKHVVSVGIGCRHTGGERSDEVCIIVGVTNKVSMSELRTRDFVPSSVGGFRTDVVEVGHIKAQENVDKVRPAPGGVSLGHRDITAGTLGCLVNKNDENFILSNNHVLANSNDGEIGDPIFQPGPFDGGTIDTNRIATLAEYAPINFGGAGGGGGTGNPFLDFILQLLCQFFGICFGQEPSEPNTIDAALARPDSPELVTKEILDIGVPTGWSQVELNEPVKKSGRTTEFTQDVVLQLHATVDVDYGNGRVATFEDQIIAGPMSAGGDSGSAVLNNDNEVIGLLFAGSNTTTILNPIEYVLNEFGINITT